jgi:hypothetical protein
MIREKADDCRLLPVQLLDCLAYVVANEPHNKRKSYPVAVSGVDTVIAQQSGWRLNRHTSLYVMSRLRNRDQCLHSVP